jgi:hypothetical protein
MHQFVDVMVKPPQPLLPTLEDASGRGRHGVGEDKLAASDGRRKAGSVVEASTKQRRRGFSLVAASTYRPEAAVLPRSWPRGHGMNRLGRSPLPVERLPFLVAFFLMPFFLLICGVVIC